MMDKIKSLLGSPSKERYEYEQYMRKLQAEDALRNQYSQGNLAQQASQASHGLGQQYHAQERYAQGWTDTRTMMVSNKPVSPEEYVLKGLADTNQAMKQLADRMDRQERRVQMLTGFYTWVTEVHPEIAAQHKAMRDLYEAANAPQQEQGKQDA